MILLPDFLWLAVSLVSASKSMVGSAFHVNRFVVALIILFQNSIGAHRLKSFWDTCQYSLPFETYLVPTLLLSISSYQGFDQGFLAETFPLKWLFK